MTSIYNKLKQLQYKEDYPFHMPGHKRNLKIDPLLDAISKIDITEITGFDDLHHPEEMIRELMDDLKQIYGTKESYLLVNSSTAGNLAAIAALCNIGDKILVARNCHKSVYHAIELLGLDPVYIYPEIDEYGICKGITKEQIENIITKETSIKAMVLVSPTYEGRVSDIEGISDVLHRNNIPLIVDEAHGAHFIYHEAFPESAVNSGADIVIQSLHKTLPAFTQTGLLHLCTDCVTREMMQKKLSIFQSSSPSYVLIASIEQCIHICNENRGYFQQYCEELWILRKKLEELKYIKLVPTDDIGKLVFSVKDTTISGEELFEILRDKYHLEMEMSELYYVIAMTSVCDTQEGYDRLYQALKEIDSEITKKNTEYVFLENNFHQNKKILKPEEAVTKDRIQIDYDDAKDEIAAEFIFLYPPGIPLVVPGEVIDEYVIDKIRQYEQYEMKVIGLDDHKIYIINR